METLNVGHYTDFFNTLSNSDQKHNGAKEWAEEHANSHKAGVTPLITKAVWSLKQEFVVCLCAKTEGKTELVPEGEGFGGFFGSHKKFSGKGLASVAARDTLKRRCTDHLKALEKVIKMAYPVGSKARALLLRMIELTKAAITAWLDFCGEYYSELVDICNHPEAVAWQFVGVIFRHICKALSKFRIPVSELSDFKDPETKAEILWAFMSSLSCMESIIDADFKSHPVVTSAMSTFLMQNRVDKSDFEAAEEKLAKFSKKVDGLEGDVKPLKSTVAEHTKQISGLQRSKQDKK
jgi:hypothetical protein